MRPWSAGIATTFHIETSYDKSPGLAQPKDENNSQWWMVVERH